MHLYSCELSWCWYFISCLSSFLSIFLWFLILSLTSVPHNLTFWFHVWILIKLIKYCDEKEYDNLPLWLIFSLVFTVLQGQEPPLLQPQAQELGQALAQALEQAQAHQGWLQLLGWAQQEVALALTILVWLPLKSLAACSWASGFQSYFWCFEDES